MPGDEILGIEDSKGERLAIVTPDAVVDFVKARGGKPISVLYLHAGATSTATVIPANAIIPNAAGQPALGVALVLVATVSEPWSEAAVNALYKTLSAFWIVGGDLWTLVQGAIEGAPNLSEVVGPVGIVSYVGDAAQNGIGAVLTLAALISVNLAIINLIPIPALDGGRLFVLIIESILRRDAPRLAVQILNALGIALILLLMFVVTYQDIARLLS